MVTTSASLSTTSTTGLGLSGLSSGLDTSGIITKLMAIESAPQTALKTRLSTATTYRTALQSLNTSVAGITTTAQNAAKAGALNSFTASSDTSGVTATASSSASAGSVSFTVDAIAKAQVSVTGAMSTWPDTSSSTPTITIQTGTGDSATTKKVTALSTNLDDVVIAINGSGAGVTASKVAAGTDDGGNTVYRLQLRGTTGAANSFSVYEGDSTSATKLPTTEVAQAQDAKITLYKGVTGAEQSVTSSTNTFSSLLTGVDVQVTVPTTAAATVSVAADSTAATTAAQSLTSSLIALFSGIASASAITTTTSSSGSTSATSGSIFTGDTAVRNIKDSLLSAVSGAVNGRSPSSIGITLTKDGTITFDQSKFASAMASDPTGTTTMFQTIAGSVAKAASAVSDPISGTLTKQITSQQGTESSLTKEISDWDTRLAAIQAQYTSQFNNLETALNSLSSQSSYLTSQIAGLTTNYQKS